MYDSVILEALAAPFQHFLKPGDRMSFLYLGTALIAAIGVYVVTASRSGRFSLAGLLRWMLPADILLHRSSRADYAFFFINRILRWGLYGSLLFWIPVVEHLSYGALVAHVGPAGDWGEPTVWTALLTAVVTLVVLDAVLWFAHWLFHKVPFLWDYHKVHHSAEVMTPITAARMHPVDELVQNVMSGVVLGVTFALLNWVMGRAAVPLEVFDINILLAVFFLAAFNLRHSHVWISYPTWLSHILISPAQHQIHHSADRKHWDRNMGFVFAVWDWAAGTLYAPKGREEITFGLGTEEDGGKWHSVTALYALPFLQNAEKLRDWRKAQLAKVAAAKAPRPRDDVATDIAPSAARET